MRQARLSRALDAGVCGIMVPAVEPSDARQLPALVSACSTQFPALCLVYALGIHPYALSGLEPGQDELALQTLATALRESVDPRLRAVGECGLHFSRVQREPAARARQIEFTRRQLDLARELQRPAILHCVGAHATLLELLDERPMPASVLHSFTGSPELAREYVRRGHYVSFSASLGHPKAKKVVEAARAVPEDRMLVETDSPDQAPHDLLPSANEPANLAYVVRALASARAERPLRIAELTHANARRAFHIEDLPT